MLFRGAKMQTAADRIPLDRKEWEMSNDRKKVLIAMDGSEQAEACAAYVCRMLDPKSTDLVFFHVQNKVPEIFWDMERYPGTNTRVAAFHNWVAQVKKEIHGFLGKSRDDAVAAGFPREAIQVVVQERMAGVARDINFELQRGYEAVAVGRTGVSKIKDLVLGSVANKILGKTSGTPLILVGGRPDTEKVLMAMDNSQGAMESVEQAGRLLMGRAPQVTLLHVRRHASMYHTEAEQEWNELTKKELVETEGQSDSVIREAATRLAGLGYPAESIKGEIIKNMESRAAAIVDYARNQGFGTIVIGRRGLSRVEEWLLGRVSQKVVQLARDRAVWVMG